MRKLVLLVGLCMLGALTVGGVAVAQTVPMGTPPCPQALDQMPPGTTCGEGGGYIFPGENPTFEDVPPSPEASPPGISSEQWRADQIAFAVESGQMTQAEACADPAYASVYPDACGDVQVGPVEPLEADTGTTPADEQYAPAGDATGGTAALPETGGISLLTIAALGLLVGGGLLLVRVIRR